MYFFFQYIVILSAAKNPIPYRTMDRMMGFFAAFGDSE